MKGVAERGLVKGPGGEGSAVELAAGGGVIDCSKVQSQPLCLRTLCAVLCPGFPARDELDSWSFPSLASPSNGVSGIYKIAVESSAFSPSRDCSPRLLESGDLSFLCQRANYSW